MTITVQCPGCQSKLNAPPVAAGKRVKCPKCQGVILVPAGEIADDFEVVEEDDFEVVEDEPAKAKPKKPLEDDADRPRKAAKKRIIDDDEEEDRPRRRDDDDEDRPRKKKGKKKPAAKSLLPLYIGGGGVLAVLLVAVGGYLLLGGEKKNKSGSGSADSWVQFSAPDGSFSVSFPAAPTTPDDVALDELIGMNRDEAAKAKNANKEAGVKTDSWMSTDGNRRYIVSMIKSAQVVSESDKVEKMLQDFTRKEIPKHGQILGEESATVSGRSTTWIRVKCNNGKTYIESIFIIGDRIYGLTIVDDQDVAVSDANVKKFLDSFTSTRKTAAGDSPSKGKDAKRRGPR